MVSFLQILEAPVNHLYMWLISHHSVGECLRSSLPWGDRASKMFRSELASQGDCGWLVGRWSSFSCPRKGVSIYTAAVVLIKLSSLYAWFSPTQRTFWFSHSAFTLIWITSCPLHVVVLVCIRQCSLKMPQIEMTEILS